MTTKDLREMNRKRANPKCGFCGHSASDGANVVVAPNGLSICDECARKVVGMVENDGVESNPFAKRDGSDGNANVKRLPRIPTPREIVALLDEHVIGQDDVKKTLATAVYNHYSRLRSRNNVMDDELKDVQVEK